MERWIATYVGSEIVTALASADAWEVLDLKNLETWQSGGCGLLTAVLCEAMPGSPYMLVREDGVIDHLACEYGGYFFDADGAFTEEELIAKHKCIEGYATELVPADEAVASQWLGGIYWPRPNEYPSDRRALNELEAAIGQAVSWSLLR